jgi:hypothetical protein
MSDENITFDSIDNNENFETIEQNFNYLDLTKMIDEINIDESYKTFFFNDEGKITAKNLDYGLNYLIKDLLLICDYYGISKDIKKRKLKKEKIIHLLVNFEEDISNIKLVNKRKQLWYYMNELKNDKFMKKFIL